MAEGSVHFLNLEYFFRLLYALATNTTPPTADINILLISIWQFVIVVGYGLSALFLGLMVYFTMRFYQTQKAEEKKYETIEPERALNEVKHARWQHIESLIESPTDSDWRQAIIEADIMLDDLLRARGYAGETVGERLKQVVSSKLTSLNDAWEAHKVRNEIAHQGSAFKISEHAAHRTIARYENVFHELGEI